MSRGAEARVDVDGAQAERVEAGEVLALREALAAAHERIDVLAKAYQAGERDREAFKQRVSREREQLLDVERGGVAVALLEAIDDLDRVIAAAPPSALREGVALVRDGLRARALATGIEAVPLEGRPFDPTLAEAVDVIVSGRAADDGLVTRVVRPAWALKGRVIREGRVQVARYAAPQA